MTQNKFRAWDKSDKRLITHEQEFVPLKVTNIGVFRQDCDSGKWELLERDRFILTQNLPYKDMHGTEVYEGDIVTSGIKDISGKMTIGVITYHESTLGIVCLSNIVCSEYLGYSHSQKMEFLSRECTVIGNVFEDSELLPENARDYASILTLLESLGSCSTTPLGATAPTSIAPCCRRP